MAEQPEERERPGVSRQYGSLTIRVNWEPEYCIHASMCWRNLPRVFRPNAKPWVEPDKATTDEIARVIMMCPTGALSFERLDGGPQERPPDETTIEAVPDGPLYIRGRVRVEDGSGNVIREATRVALCRCGHSENKPFCDLSHVKVRFRAE